MESGVRMSLRPYLSLLIIVPKSKSAEEEELSRMVDEINHEQLAREEILSNHAYRYYCEKKELVALPLIPYRKD